MQHLSPRAQLEHKQSILRENLLRIAKLEPERWLPPLEGPVWGYRRRARLAVKDVPGKGRVLVGFRERRKPFVTDMRRCPVLAPPTDRLLEPLSELIGQLGISARIPQVETAVGDARTALVFRVLDAPDTKDLERLREFGRRYDVDVWLQPGGLDSVAPLAVHGPLVYGLPEAQVTLGFAPTDFVQVNARLNRAMVARTVELLAPGSEEQVLDLFCGLGNFTLALARRAAQVVGVEGDASLIARARANAAANDLHSVELHVSDLAGELTGQAWAERRYQRILLDPPRTGAREVLAGIPRWAPRRIAYVSCHPATLARDAATIVREFGFRLTSAGVMDMFPHTSHVESVAIFDAGG